MKPFEHLPHRYPFIMLDTADIVEEGKHARGTKQITINDRTVLPDGTMPGVYIIEAMAQISGIASGRKGGSVFAAINNLTFSGTANAGDMLDVESTLERNIGSLYIFSCKASVAAKTIAEGEIILHLNAE